MPRQDNSAPETPTFSSCCTSTSSPHLGVVVAGTFLVREDHLLEKRDQATIAVSFFSPTIMFPTDGLPSTNVTEEASDHCITWIRYVRYILFSIIRQGASAWDLKHVDKKNIYIFRFFFFRFFLRVGDKRAPVVNRHKEKLGDTVYFYRSSRVGQWFVGDFRWDGRTVLRQGVTSFRPNRCICDWRDGNPQPLQPLHQPLYPIVCFFHTSLDAFR